MKSLIIEIMDNRKGFMIPILIILLIVVFMIPLSGFIINFDDSDELNTPFQDLNNLSLNSTFTVDNDTNFIELNNGSLNDIFTDNAKPIDYHLIMGNKVHIDTRGKNLLGFENFDFEYTGTSQTAVSGIYTSHGLYLLRVSNSGFPCAQRIEVSPNTLYTLSFNVINSSITAGAGELYIYNDGLFGDINDKVTFSGDGGYSVSFTTSNAYIVVAPYFNGLTVDGDNYELINIQLETGPLVTEYEEHYHDDYLGNVQWEIGNIEDTDTVQKLDSYIFSDTESWSFFTSYTNVDYIFISRSILDGFVLTGTTNDMINVEGFEYSNDIQDHINSVGTVTANGGGNTVLWFGVSKDSISTVTEAREYMVDRLAIYELETPITENLTKYYYSHENQELFDISTPYGFGNEPTLSEVNLLLQFYKDNLYNYQVFEILYNYDLSESKWNYYNTLYNYYITQ